MLEEEIRAATLSASSIWKWVANGKRKWDFPLSYSSHINVVLKYYFADFTQMWDFSSKMMPLSRSHDSIQRSIDINKQCQQGDA